HNPFRSRYCVPITDTTLFIDRDVDDDLIEDLLFAFAVVNWSQKPLSITPRDRNIEPWPVYALLKHLFLPEPLKTRAGPVLLRADARVISRLTAGDVSGASDIALRRLRITNFVPIEGDYAGGVDAQRLAAALLIPVPYGPALRNPVLN